MGPKKSSLPTLSESWDSVNNVNDDSSRDSTDTETLNDSDYEPYDDSLQLKSNLKERRRSNRETSASYSKANLPTNKVTTNTTYEAKPQKVPTRRRHHNRADTGPEFIMPSPSQEVPDYLRESEMRDRLRERTALSSATFGSPSKTSSGRSKQKVTKSKNPSTAPLLFGVEWNKCAWGILSYILPIISGAMSILRPFLSFLLAVTLLVLVGSAITKRLTDSLSLCQFPAFTFATSFLHLPICQPQKAAGPVEFDQLISVQASFEDVLSTSARGASLPLEMKHSEASIRDLRTAVVYSTLPSRNEIVFELNGFVETARQASMDLSRFNSHIGRAVDYILNVNRWTLQVIDSVSQREKARGAMTRFIETINILSTHDPQQALLDQYLYHTHAVEERIDELIIEAQAILGILQSLDERLDVIADIAARDGYHTKGSRDELLETLWVKLGGKKATVGKLNDQLGILRQLGTYRKMAWAHVSGTVVQLQAMAAGLEDLRERVAAPDIVGVRKEVPLRVHVENIHLGVERLESQRWVTRKMESEMYRQVLDKDYKPDGIYLDG